MNGFRITVAQTPKANPYRLSGFTNDIKVPVCDKKILLSVKGSLQGWRSLQWRHNGHDGVSIHQPHDCLLNHAEQRKQQSSASPAFMRGIHRWTVKSLHKGPVTRKMFPFDDVIIWMAKLLVMLAGNTGSASDDFLRCRRTCMLNGILA